MVAQEVKQIRLDEFVTFESMSLTENIANVAAELLNLLVEGVNEQGKPIQVFEGDLDSQRSFVSEKVLAEAWVGWQYYGSTLPDNAELNEDLYKPWVIIYAFMYQSGMAYQIQGHMARIELYEKAVAVGSRFLEVRKNG